MQRTRKFTVLLVGEFEVPGTTVKLTTRFNVPFEVSVMF